LQRQGNFIARSTTSLRSVTQDRVRTEPADEIRFCRSPERSRRGGRGSPERERPASLLSRFLARSRRKTRSLWSPASLPY